MTRPHKPHGTEPDAEARESVQWAGPSRSQKKRDAQEVTALGLRLTELSDRELGVLALDDELLEALAECRRLSKNARARQLRLIGKMLRDRELDKLREGLGLVQGKRSAERAREQGVEAQRRVLIEGGDAALESYLREHPRADRQQLRQLVREARRTPPTPPSQRAFRQLLRELRALAAEVVNAEADGEGVNGEGDSGEGG